MPESGSTGSSPSGEELAPGGGALLVFCVNFCKTGLKETLGEHLFQICVGNRICSVKAISWCSYSTLL